MVLVLATDAWHPQVLMAVLSRLILDTASSCLTLPLMLWELSVAERRWSHPAVPKGRFRGWRHVQIAAVMLPGYGRRTAIAGSLITTG